ncbi:winged helix-turn-helix domain-containing protein [Halorussus halophilus]|uniref:winged helix-turn-helix domain-containing protein n=1 Tax=Halorussus halophilus TaxID=2650975 RepID=UPI0013010766|nr:helix-turn-helix domain-containing protein [Halorussus halophilus]
MSEDWELTDVVSLLDDEYARAILRETSIEPMSASTLSERCDASLPTIYRRVNALTDADLLTERTELDGGGDHYSVYAGRLDRLTIDLDDGTFDLDVSLTEDDPADRFTDLFEGLR